MLLNSNYIYMWLIGVRKVYLPQGPWTFLTPLYSQYDPFINIGVAMEGVRGRAGKGGGWNQSWNLRKIKNFGGVWGRMMLGCLILLTFYWKISGLMSVSTPPFRSPGYATVHRMSVLDFFQNKEACMLRSA